jgi:hypothetical protein
MTAAGIDLSETAFWGLRFADFENRIEVAVDEIVRYVMLRELLTRVPDITAGEPARLLSSFVNGIKRLPCQFGG